MSILDILRLAHERAAETGDDMRPEFFNAMASTANLLSSRTEGTLSSMLSKLGDNANDTCEALTCAARSQMEFGDLMASLPAEPSRP